jgi:hypothetical protein
VEPNSVVFDLQAGSKCCYKVRHIAGQRLRDPEHAWPDQLLDYQTLFNSQGVNMENIVLRAPRPRSVGLGDDSKLEGLSEGARTAEHFDEIDWSTAAPSWVSMLTGLVVPCLAFVALVVSIDVALCWLIEGWIDYSWRGAPWLFLTVMLPVALVFVFCCGKLALHYLNAARHKR